MGGKCYLVSTRELLATFVLIGNLVINCNGSRLKYPVMLLQHMVNVITQHIVEVEEYDELSLGSEAVKVKTMPVMSVSDFDLIGKVIKQDNSMTLREQMEIENATLFSGERMELKRDVKEILKELNMKL